MKHRCVLDWYTKTSVGHDVGFQVKTSQWLAALDLAVQCQFQPGAVTAARIF